MERHRHGNARVFYDAEGRVYYQGHDDHPASLTGEQPHHPVDYRYHSYDPDRDEKRRSRQQQYRYDTDVTPFRGRADDSRPQAADLPRVTRTVVHHHVTEHAADDGAFPRGYTGYQSFQDISRRHHDLGGRGLGRGRDHLYPHPLPRADLPALTPHGEEFLPLPPPNRAPSPPGGGSMERRGWRDRPRGYGLGPGGYDDREYAGPPSYGSSPPPPVERGRGVLSSSRPPAALFALSGALLAVIGVLTTLACGAETHAYCQLWAGALVFGLGASGFIHRGNYYSVWKNVLYVFLGLVTSAAALVGVALVSRSLAPQILALAATQYDGGSLEAYLQGEVDTRPWPYVNISSSREEVIWTCLTFDCAAVLLFLIDFFSLAAAVIVADHFWNANYYFTKKIAPFCSPRLFNPYHQMSVGQAMALGGVVLYFSTTGTQFHTYWGPVWAGFIAMVSGGLSAAARKRHDLKWLSASGVLMEVVNLLASTAAAILCTFGMVDNIRAVMDGDIDASDTMGADFARRHVIASACLAALVDMIILVNMFFSIALIYRLIRYLSRKPSSRYRTDRHYSHSFDAGPYKPHGQYDYDHTIRPY